MLKVLMIDDDREELMLVREMIHAAGDDIVHVEWVANTSQALTMLEIDDFGLFLVDRDLGSELGADFIQRARDAGIRTSAVFYTASRLEDLDDKTRQWLDHGVGYINKSSIQPEELLAAIRDYALHTVHALEVYAGQKVNAAINERIGRISLKKRVCLGLADARAAAEEGLWDLVIFHVPNLQRDSVHDVLRLKAECGLSPILLICRGPVSQLPLQLELLRQSGQLQILAGGNYTEEALQDAVVSLVQ